MSDRNLDCVRCRDAGHKCAATHELDGEPICVFCEDGLPCPIIRREQRAARDRKPQPTPIAEVNRETTVEKTVEQENGAAVTTRICAKPGCTTEIGPKNRSGRCGPHFHWKPGTRRSTGNVHVTARSTGTNGHAAETDDAAAMPPNGSDGKHDRVEPVADLAGDFRVDRLDRLILSLTVAEKSKIASAWLCGGSCRFSETA